MGFSDNLYYLRKRAGLTQEELADRVQVSRQSVSKWETGEALPETDKLILLSDVFGVTLDEIVRGNLCENANEAEEVYSDADGYREHMNMFSLRISLGVFLVLIGVSVCVMIAGVANLYTDKMQDIVGSLSGVAIMLFIAVAVVLFITAGIRHDNFRKKNPKIGKVFSSEEEENGNRKFTAAIAALVPAIIIDAAALVVAFVVADNMNLQYADFVSCAIFAVFMFILAFIVGGLCYAGIQHEKFNYGEYNKDADSDKNKKINDAVCSAIMLTATALFLVIGFVWGLWHPGWVVFPVGGIICGIVSSVLKIKKD